MNEYNWIFLHDQFGILGIYIVLCFNKIKEMPGT